MEDATIIQQIMEKRNEMTKTERRITDYILNHKHNVAQMTISQLADACGTSTSSITRFTRLFGFDSYLDFRMALARNNIIEKTRFSSTQAEDQREEFGDVYEAIQPEDSIELKTQKLYQIAVTTLQQSVELIDPEQIDLAVDLMIQANNVFCYGQGNSSLVAKDAWGRFSFVTSKFHSIEDAHMQRNIAAILGDKDVVLYFSYSGLHKNCLMWQPSFNQRTLNSSSSLVIVIHQVPNGGLCLDLWLERKPNSAGIDRREVCATLPHRCLV